MAAFCDIPFLVPNSEDHPGSFASVRKHDVHCGVDIYLPEGTPVRFLRGGEVIALERFTGPLVGTPWWNDTWAVHVYTGTDTDVYGEVYEPTHLKVGQKVYPGQLCGHIAKVLKVMKGRPMTMLHFEQYDGKCFDSAVWNLGESKPYKLLDPTEFLLEVRKEYIFQMMKELL